jgi:hypothetical protein
LPGLWNLIFNSNGRFRNAFDSQKRPTQDNILVTGSKFALGDGCALELCQ